MKRRTVRNRTASKSNRRQNSARRFRPLLGEQLEARELLAIDMGYQIRVVNPGAPLFVRDPLNLTQTIATPNLPTVNIGQAYDLVVTVQDLRPGGTGAFAGFLDITYDSSKTTVQAAEVQRLAIGPFSATDTPSLASGTFTLTFGTQTTGSIQFSANLDTTRLRIQQALEGLSNVGIGHVDVTLETFNSESTAANFLIRFPGKFLGQDAPNTTIASQNLVSTGSVNPTVSISYDGDLAAGIPALAFREAFRSRGIPSITDVPGTGTPPREKIYYPNGLNAGNLPNRLDDVGAAGDNSVPLPNSVTASEIAAGYDTAPPRELVRARFIATSVGTITFTPDFSDRTLPLHHSLLYGSNVGLNLDQINPGTPVSLIVNAVPVVEYQVRLVPPGGALFQRDPGNPTLTVPTQDISAAIVGQTYDLVVTVNDLRPGEGVFGGYVDINYDSSKTQVQAAEIQKVIISGGRDPAFPIVTPGSTFTLNFGGSNTAPISFSPAATTMEVRIRNALLPLLPAGGDVEVRAESSVHPEPMVFNVKFVGTLRGQNVANMTVAATAFSGGNPASPPAVNVTYEGDLQGGTSPLAFAEAFRSFGIPTIEGVLTGRPPLGYFPNGLNAGNLPNVLDDIGAVGDNSSPKTGVVTDAEIAAGYEAAPPRELVRVRMIATNVGPITFTPDMVNRVLPAHDTLLNGRNTAVGYSTVPNQTEILLGTPRTLNVVANPITAVADNPTIPEDAPPTVVDVLVNDTVEPGGSAKVVVSVTQPTNGVVTFTANNVSYDPNDNFNGIDTFTYVAHNTALGPSGPTSTGTVTVSVSAVNDAPTLDAITDRTVQQNAPGLSVALSGISEGPANEAAQTVSISAVSSNPAVVSNLSINYSDPNPTGTLNYSAVGGGTATVTVTVTDSGLPPGTNVTTRSFTVTVDPVNSPPLIDPILDPPTLLEDAALQTINLTGISPGLNEAFQTVSISATSNNPGLLANPLAVSYSGGTTGSINFTPVGNVSGSAVITLTLVDNGGVVGGGSDTTVRTINISVSPVNDAPTFSTLGDQNSTDRSGIVEVLSFATAISVGPPDEATQTFGFNVSNNNNSLFTVQPTIDNAGKLTYTVAPNVAGSATVTATLTDSGGTGSGGDNDSVQTFQINVTKPLPWFNARNRLDVNNSQGTFPVSALDALIIFNVLNAFPGVLPPGSANNLGNFVVLATAPIPTGSPLISTPFFYDTSADNFISALDALLVINFINANPGGGEGESAWDQAVAAEAARAGDSADLIALLAADAEEARRRRRG